MWAVGGAIPPVTGPELAQALEGSPSALTQIEVAQARAEGWAMR